MFAADQLALYAAAALILNLTPGPDMLYVTARSLGQGRAAGLVSALGVFVGCIAHILAAALGLTALLRSVPWAFSAIRWIGAAYLLWLGLRTLTTKSTASVQNLPTASLTRVFLQGLATNVLNPKVALFFLAFVPQFIDPARGDPTTQFLILGFGFDVSGTTILMIVALAASRLRATLTDARWSRRLRMAMGATFVALGARLAVQN